VIADLKNSMAELKDQIKNQPKVQVEEKSNKKPLVTIKQVESILNNNDKEKKTKIQSGWDFLKDYPKTHLKMVSYMLYQTSLEAVSQEMLLVADDITSCKKLMLPETKKLALEIFNNKTHLIDDYIVILKSDWLIIKEIYLDLWKKGQKKPKLPPYDLKLYEEINHEEQKEPEIIRLAKEYFGDKVMIKE
jgi:DNA polymerase-3 subunit gamma/tau